MPVSTSLGDAFCVARFIIVIQNTRQLRMQKTAIKFARRCAGSELRVFGFAARFQNLVKHLDLPAHGIPVELLDGVLVQANGQVGDELPVDAFSTFRRAAFLCMDHRLVLVRTAENMDVGVP